MLVLLCAITNHTIKALTVSQKITVHGMITWAKKKFKQIYQYRAKGTYFGYMRDLKKIKKQHSFRR